MNTHFMLIPTDAAWRIAHVCNGEPQVRSVPMPTDATLEARAVAIREALAADGYAGQPIVLAIESSSCLSATISTTQLERGNRRRALAFRLEEHLPISVEQSVADYADAGDGEALGVCTELEGLQPLVHSLEQAGIAVGPICPLALLAAAHATAPHPEAGAVLLGPPPPGPGPAAPAYDWVELRRGKPACWRWWAEGDDALREHLTAWAASQGTGAHAVVIGGHIPSGTDRNIIFSHIERLDGDRAAALQAARIADGTASPWIDLRRDALAAPGRSEAYRRPLTILAATLALLLVCVTAATQWRGRQYAALQDRFVQEQVAVFKTALPDQRIPGSIHGRLLSECRRLAGLGGQTVDGARPEVLRPISALLRLRDVLDGLPTDVRYTLQDLSLQPDLIRLDGQALGHAEADRLAVALRHSGRYQVDPPKTQLLKEGGVGFLLSVQPTVQGGAR